MSAKSLVGCRVLVVEDEWFIAYDLTEHLEQAGAIVLGPVSSEPEALKTLGTLDRLPDVASLDFKIAGGTSIRIAEELDRLGVPFIFATGTPELIPDPYRKRLICPKPVFALAWLSALAEMMAA